jgi:hypothetical protein
MNRMRCVGHVACNQTVTRGSCNILVLKTQTNRNICGLGLDRITVTNTHAVPDCTLQHTVWVFVCSDVVWRFGGTHCNCWQGRCNDNRLRWLKPARARREEGPFQNGERGPFQNTQLQRKLITRNAIQANSAVTFRLEFGRYEVRISAGDKMILKGIMLFFRHYRQMQRGTLK